MQTLSHQNPRHIRLPLFAAVLASALAAELCLGQSSVGGNTTPLPPAAGSVSQTRNIPSAPPNATVSGDYPGQGSGGVAVANSQSGVNVTTIYGSNNRPQIGISRALRYAEAVKPSDVLYLCLSIASCAVAFFMLYQSIALQKMLTHGRENAPDPDAGAGVAWLLFWLTCGVYSFYWVASAQGRTGYSEPLDFFRQDWWGAALETPRAFAPALLIASIAPGAIALYKFAFALAWLHSRNVRARGLARFAVGGIMKQDSDSVLSRLDENMSTLRARIAVLETELATPAKGTRVVTKQPDKERRAEILYVTTLSVIFCVVMGGLMWAAARGIPIASIFSVVVCAGFVIILLGVFDLSKAGKLSERSLMQVLRSAFKFMSRHPK